MKSFHCLIELLPRKILRMSFSGENQLNRTLRIGKKTDQPLWIVQKKIGTLIGGKAARKSQRQHILIKDAAGIRRVPTFRGELTRVALAHSLDQAFSPCCAQLP